eukprot:CAMPEP_0119477764 /NCGR_PEP_ID=MMETSP1344-20130328/7795_1 /TAXON_ID=236787 /ORGANISM="Florenciella parvula, Strain CCMP2471" /LENGTH=47 /DNA_ID= /DNA_START= /DNA_END= /DNA_ORIENTATION=
MAGDGGGGGDGGGSGSGDGAVIRHTIHTSMTSGVYPASVMAASAFLQ